MRHAINRTFAVALVATLFAAAIAVRPTVARAAGGASSFDARSAVSKVILGTPGTGSTAPATLAFYWSFKSVGTLWDFQCTQITAGTGGTSLSFDIKKNGTTMLSTLGAIPIGAGADKTIDARKELTAVANTTRPVIKPRGAAIRVAKGDKVEILVGESGTYSPHPTASCTAVFLPDL